MRKRGFIIATMLTAIFGAFCPGIAAEGERRFSLGLAGGGGPAAPSWPSWRAGVELGFRFGKQWAVAADLSYGSLALENTSSSGTYSAREVQTWTALPIALTLRFAEPLADRAVVSIGAGVGYHTLTRIIETETNVSGQRQTGSAESSFHAWAPHAEAGLEIILGKIVSLTGRLRYEFGVASQQSTISGLAASQDFSIGGVSFAVGARFYLF